MKFSARNTLKDTAKSLMEGSINAEVVIEIAQDLEVTSIITKSFADGLGLTVGSNVYAVIKASEVMVAVG